MHLLSILIPGWRVELDPRTILPLVLVRSFNFEPVGSDSWGRRESVHGGCGQNFLFCTPRRLGICAAPKPVHGANDQRPELTNTTMSSSPSRRDDRDTPSTPSGVVALHERLTDWSSMAAGAFSANTIRAWRAAPKTVRAFVFECLGKAKKPATVRRYVPTIGRAHRASGVGDPTTSEEVKLALKEIGRNSNARQRLRSSYLVNRGT
jgi:hypothetical protein